MRTAYLIPALFIASISAPAAAATNILSNPGFETGSRAPWTITANCRGVTCALANWGTLGVAVLGEDSIQQTFAAIATSNITEVSFWALRDGGPFDSYTFYYSDATHADFILNALGASGWNQYNVTSNLAAGKNLVGFSIYGTSPGPTYLDDFVIATGGAVPEPSTWAMMLLGFAGIGLTLRRRRRGALQTA